MGDYRSEASEVYTKDGQAALLRALDHARKAARIGGAVTAFSMMNNCSAGSSWLALNVIDALEEQGYIKKVGTGWRNDDAVYVVKMEDR